MVDTAYSKEESIIPLIELEALIRLLWGTGAAGMDPKTEFPYLLLATEAVMSIQQNQNPIEKQRKKLQRAQRWSFPE